MTLNIEFWYYSILGNVCGGHCLSKGQDCQCGQETIPFSKATYSNSYCCSDSCSKVNDTVTCQNGNIKNLKYNCNNSCPFLKFGDAINKMAISTTDCNPEKEHCFDFVGSFNKICSNGSSTFYEYCSSNGGKTCPPATSKIQFEQCYESE